MQGGTVAARRASTPLLGAALAVLTWRGAILRPVDSLDPSWQAALHMAAHLGLPYKGLVFTYGPLGFLAQPVAYYPTTFLLSTLYVFGVETAFCAALVSALRRSVSLPVAAVATFLLVRGALDLGVVDVVVVTVVVAAFGLLRGDHSVRTERILVLAGAVVAGTHLLVKLNSGITIFVVTGVTAWFVGRRGWRSEAVSLGAAGGSMLAGWLVTGNGVADLVPFLERSLQVASGYSEAMSIEASGRGAFYPLAAGVVGVVVSLGWRATRGWTRRRRVGIGLAGAMWLFAAFKLGFVRHDGHDVAFFGETLVMGAVLAGSVAASLAGARKVVPAAAVVALLVPFIMASGLDLTAVVNPGPELARAGRDFTAVSSQGSRERTVEKARANLRSRYYNLPAPILAELRGRTVHIRPWEAGIAWAYPELRWRPVPVFQEYSAYTADLDHLDAAFLSGPQAPERILTEQVTIDLRNPDWESPATVVAIVCHYRELVIQGRWQVLGRVADRCGTRQTLDVVKARVGDTVAVPDTRGRKVVLVARITGLDDSLLYRLRSTLWRTPEVHVDMDGGRRSRLVPGTAPDGLIVQTPAVGLGFSQPFAPESTAFLRLEQDSGIGLTPWLSIEFVAIPVLR